MGTSDRNSGLGASDAAPACGLSQWKTPLQLYKEKLGEAPDSRPETLALELGKVLEPFILGQLLKERPVRLTDLQKQIQDPVYPWRWVTVDAIADGNILVEAKNSTYGHGFTDDDIPMGYILQVQHGLAVTGFQMALVPVLVGAREVRVYEVGRDEELIELLTEKEKEFWQRVVDRRPPAPISVAEANRVFRKAEQGSTVVADEPTLASVEALRALRTSIKEMEKEADQRELLIKLSLGPNEGLVDTTGNTLVTWKNQTSRRLDQSALKAARPEVVAEFTKESESRVFRIK